MFLGPAYVVEVVQDVRKLGAPFMSLAMCTRSASPKWLHGLTSHVGRSILCMFSESATLIVGLGGNVQHSVEAMHLSGFSISLKRMCTMTASC